jgi:site-specific DNA-methyltransferase (adenine-specific)
MTREHLEQCRHLFRDVPEWVERECDIRSVESRNFAEREIVGEKASGLSGGTGHTVGRFTDSRNDRGLVNITAPATASARQWQGWGTALKPAWEPIIVARKPLVGTVAENVLTHGTGGINVDGCRVASNDEIAAVTGRATLCGTRDGYDRPWKHDPAALAARQERANVAIEKANTLGRWPANLIHDGSEEVVGLFPEQQSGPNPRNRGGIGYHSSAQGQSMCHAPRGADSGSAARFFYCAKASKADRDEGCEGLPLRKEGTWGGEEDDLSDGKKKIHPSRNHHPAITGTCPS